jgi:hypothetical protein
VAGRLFGQHLEMDQSIGVDFPINVFAKKIKYAAGKKHTLLGTVSSIASSLC